MDGNSFAPVTTLANDDLAVLAELERKILWLASWTIHNANHLREHPDGLKVGGHQASCASLTTIMTALYLATLRPQDRVAVKPHAAPVFHAIQYLLGQQTREKLEAFRALGGAQSYPSRTKDSDDVDFSTGSVGLGVAQTLFASLAQDYLRLHDFGTQRPEGRMISLVGDAEMDEGNIFEAILEGWKQGLRNCWWVIDYNRQSLDAVVREGLWARYEALFRAFGWDVVIVKHGSLQRAAFAEPGGERLRDWIDTCPNQLYSALVFQGGAAWRKRLTSEFANDPAALALIGRRNDAELAALMNNLGGHDLPSLIDAFASIDHDRPVCFICYTIKGMGLPLAGHKDNHAGLMNLGQMETFRAAMGVREGHEWDKFEGLALPQTMLSDFLDHVGFKREGTRRHVAARIPTPETLPVTITPTMSTQMGFGAILNEVGKQKDEFASRIVTTSPDVTVSTNLGGWVNRRGLFARNSMSDTFKSERIPSTFNWEFSPQGQHMELGIAEMNLFIQLSALGLSHALHGERLLPIGTLYDPFICRGLDALNYACYQDSRFIVAATPSGVTLAPEGGAHQSISTPLIGMAQPGLSSFEPAFVDELATVMAWSFSYIQNDAKAVAPQEDLLADARGGAVYLRLSTRPVEQPQRVITPELREDIINGAYWLRRPGPNCQLVVAYTGAVAPEAIQAVGLLGETHRDIGLLAITSADRLKAGWMAANRAREDGDSEAEAHIETLLNGLPPHCALVTVLDGHPTTLSWLGSVRGQRVRPLGVEQFGQTGTIADLYRVNGIDSAAIIRAAQAVAPARRVSR